MLDNDKSTSKFIRGSAALFAGRLISIAIKFFVQVLIVRYLSKSDFGAFAYALNMVEMAMILSLLALDRAASRFVPIYDELEDYDSLLGFIALSLVTVIGLSVALILLFVAGRNLLLGSVITDPLSLSLLLILIILTPLQALDNWIQSIFAAFNEVRAILLRRYVLWPMLQLAAILLVIFTQSNVYWLAGGYLAGGAIGTIMYAAMLNTLLRNRGITQHFNLQTIRLNTSEVFGFSLPLFLTGVVFIIRSRIAIILLEFFHGTIAVAEFRAVQPAVRLNSVVYDSFVFLYLPLASRMFAKGDDEGINDLFWRTTAWISIASFPVFLATFSLAQPLVELLFGNEYASSGVIMAIMAFGAYFNSFMGFNKDTLRAYNQVKFLMIVDLAVIVAALLSFVLLIPRYGAVGGAIAMTIATILNNLLYHVGLIRYTSTKVFDWSYLRVYVMIFVGAIGLGLVQIVFSPPLYVSGSLGVLVSLLLLRFNAGILQIGELFPELLRVPLLNRLLNATPSEHGRSI